jgi:uncharacterized protein with PIN domain
VERFLVDEMLLRLGRWMRLLGQDVANPEGATDSELLQRAKAEHRTLVTRDRRLAEACKSAGAKCILVKSSELEDQLAEMADHGIALRLDPSRCTLCNSPLESLEKSPTRKSAGERVPLERIQLARAETESEGRETWRCTGCGKLYWEGAHWKRMKEVLEAISSSKR